MEEKENPGQTEEEGLEEIEGIESEANDDVEEVQAEGAEGAEKKPADKEVGSSKFVLPEAETTTVAAEVESGSVDIVHNGQVHRITKEKMVELAQKGFDYDVKVGPHGKLVQMIDSDPELSNIVDDYWKRKVGGDTTEKAKPFEVKSLDEFDSEEEWLKENIATAMKSYARPVPSTVSQQPTNTAADALRMRDPEFFNKVYPHLDRYAESLSVKDYKKVDSDIGSLFKFYDYVKKQELNPEKTAQQAVPPIFHTKSGGGEAPKASNASPAWKMSKGDFQKQLNKIKGYG